MVGFLSLVKFCTQTSHMINELWYELSLPLPLFECLLYRL